MTNTRITRGKIFFADIPKTVGSTYFGKRPVLVLSNNLNNKFSKTITAIPCTTRVDISHGGKKKDLPTHVYIPSTKGGTGARLIFGRNNRYGSKSIGGIPIMIRPVDIPSVLSCDTSVWVFKMLLRSCSVAQPMV